MRKRDLGVGWWWVIAGGLFSSACAPPPPPEQVASPPSAVSTATGAERATASPAAPAAAERSLPIVPLAAESCTATRAAQLAPSDRVGAAFLEAERAACDGRSAEAVRGWREAAALAPRLGDVVNRRIAQATGGAARGVAASQSFAGALTGGPEGAATQWAAQMDEATLFSLEPAPWIRAKVDNLRWQRVFGHPDSEAGLRWAVQWLQETETGDEAAWLERLNWLRAHPKLNEVDRQLLSGRCVERLRPDDSVAPSASRRAAVMDHLRPCVEGVAAAEGSSDWLVGDAAESLDSPDGREVIWRHLVAARRSDADAEALALAEGLAAAPTEWRGAEALRVCVTLGASLGALDRASRCEAQFQALRPYLRWDEAGAYEMAFEGALRARPVTAGLAALADRMQGVAEPKRRLVEARNSGDSAPLQALIADAPLSYESVIADRLLRQDGGAGELGSKLAALRYASVETAAAERGWAAGWLAAKGFVGMARSEALLQAEVEGAVYAEHWAVAADLLARNGDFAEAHTAARRLATLAGSRPGLTARIAGRVWRESYPLMWEKEVAAASAHQGVPMSLLLAFLRRESGFDADARSSVGASGLMQVLPATAREVASRHGISLANGLSDPQVNLEVSAAMIAELLAEFEGRVEVVAAAYSAGPSKARRWLRGHEGGDLWLWTEAIPYDVVRSYAREIAVSSAVYAAWLGEAPPPAHITLPLAR